MRTNLPLILLEAMAAVKNRLPYPNFHGFDMKWKNTAERKRYDPEAPVSKSW